MSTRPLVAVGSTLYFTTAGPDYTTGTQLWRLNNAPVANTDAYTADRNTVLTVPAAAGVLANDTDADPGDIPNLSASLDSGPAHAASFTLNADGSFSYTPATGYTGPDSFTYRTFDGVDYSDIATVNLSVIPVVRGTTGADTIMISSVSGQIQAVVNGTTLPLFSATEQLFVYGGDGADTITVNAAPTGGVVIEGGDGSDTYVVSFGSLAGTAAISDTGATGSDDSLTINGTSVADILTKGAGFVRWQPAANDPYQEMTFAGIDATPQNPIVLNAGGGNDTIIDPDSSSFLILGGDGDDTIIIQNTVGTGVVADGGNGSDTYVISGGSLQGPVTLSDSGTSGTNSVTVVGTAGTDTITQSGRQITVNGGAPITLASGVSSLTVDGGGGSGDTYSTTGTPTIIPTVSGVDAAVVSGTAGNDDIHIRQGGQSGQVTVWLNGALVGTYSPTTRLVVHGLAGNDDIQADGNVTAPLWLYGDAGDDRLKGGAGNNVLIGGAGDDLLVGGNNRDILIGGAGADRIVGNAADDILIAGSTAFDADADESALALVLAEWTSGRSYAERVHNIMGTGTGSSYASRLNGIAFLVADESVYDDGAADVMTGSSGQDWFWANLDTGVRDKITDLSAAEFALDLDFINS